MKQEFKKLTPFKLCALQNFPFIDADFDALTNYELMCKIVEYLNNVIDAQNKVDSKIEYIINWFNNLNIQDEVDKKLDEMAESGELTQLITLYLELPNGNTFDAQRIGRKILFGTTPTSSDYDPSGIAVGMQGGCVIDENTVAYMLWDNLNINLNKNKLIIMNINSGEIIKEEDFNFGWCNSLTYDKVNENIFVAVRGTTSAGVATNNGEIKVIDFETLSLIDEFELPINVNAISFYNDTIYALQENTNSIYLYNKHGEYKGESIVLKSDITNLYNQNIKVTDKYIYLISTKPSNLLNVYMLNGTHLKAYNVPKYGGLYKIGELQWLDVLKGTDMILASNITNYEESMNQFFKINLVENISTNKFNEDYNENLYVDSTTNNYNPDGTENNKFKTINECDAINIENKIINCNDKDYKYTYLHSQANCRILHAKFVEGLMVQSGKYVLATCTINYSKNTQNTSCFRFRDSEVITDNVTFDGLNNDYLINSERYNKIKFVSPTFKDYNTSVFTTNIPNTSVEINSLTNIPYMDRLYGRKFPLFNNWTNTYKTGLISYNTDLSNKQIEELFNKSQYIVIGYTPLNHADVREIVINKNGANNYTICDASVSSGSVNLRVAKMILTINKDGVNITSNTTTSVTASGTSVTSADSSSSAELFIQIRYVKLMIQD